MPSMRIVPQNNNDSIPSKHSDQIDQLFENTSPDDLLPPRLIRTAQVISQVTQYLLDDFDDEVTPKYRAVGPLANVSGDGWSQAAPWLPQTTPQVPFPLQ